MQFRQNQDCEEPRCRPGVVHAGHCGVENNACSQQRLCLTLILLAVAGELRLIITVALDSCGSIARLASCAPCTLQLLPGVLSLHMLQLSTHPDGPAEAQPALAAALCCWCCTAPLTAMVL